MRFPEKSITLKDGTQAILRAPRIEDAQPLLDFLLTTATETEFVMRCPDECDITLEQEERFIQSKLDSEYDCMIVCEISGEIAGNCDLTFASRKKIAHRGGIAIALKQKFWGKGIGTAMFREMIALAEQRPGVLQLELEYVGGNDRGRALYEKMGFEIVGRRPDAYRLQDGTLRDEILMMKKLK